MLIRDTTWERIRSQFSEVEKQQLRDVIQGQAICPKGVMIDEDRLPDELRLKVANAILGVSSARKAAGGRG